MDDTKHITLDATPGSEYAAAVEEASKAVHKAEEIGELVLIHHMGIKQAEGEAAKTAAMSFQDGNKKIENAFLTSPKTQEELVEKLNKGEG